MAAAVSFKRYTSTLAAPLAAEGLTCHANRLERGTRRTVWSRSGCWITSPSMPLPSRTGELGGHGADRLGRAGERLGSEGVSRQRRRRELGRRNRSRRLLGLGADGFGGDGGEYVARVINYAAISPYQGTAAFAKTESAGIRLRRERWKLTCQRRASGRVLARRKLHVARGGIARVDLRDACRR